MTTTSLFGFDADPDNPGWHIWGPRENGQFNTLFDPIRVLPEAPGRARVRVNPQLLLTSVAGPLHGGALLGFIDIALFAGARGCGYVAKGFPVTLELSTQFISPGRHGIALDAVVELVRETGRLLFLRGTVEQDGEMVATFIATIRKAS